MAQSKIHICNVALAGLGQQSIRDFDEDNKRARMCDVFFESLRDWLLSKFDWPFAKRFAKLQPLADRVTPPGFFAYGIPSDSKTIRDMYPPGSGTKWEVMGDMFLCEIDPESEVEVYVYYTASEPNPSMFTDTFCMVLSKAMMVYMGPALTQDKKLVQLLSEGFQMEQRDAWESDANIGNMYREHDDDPNNDSFVYPQTYSSVKSDVGGDY